MKMKWFFPFLFLCVTAQASPPAVPSDAKELRSYIRALCKNVKDQDKRIASLEKRVSELDGKHTALEKRQLKAEQESNVWK